MRHELHQGLAAINLWGTVLRHDNLSPTEHERAVDAILSSSASLGDRIDQLLELLRLATVSSPSSAQPCAIPTSSER